MTRVLVIEDDELARQTLEIALRRMGVEVFVAPDGETGLRLFDTVRADIVITDMVMPGLDGLDVIGKLRAKAPDVAIVAISGGGRFINADNCLENASQMGVNRVLRKPFNLFELKSLVAELASGSS
jgi:DNA-binding response OmpR family regulator